MWLVVIDPTSVQSTRTVMFVCIFTINEALIVTQTSVGSAYL